MRDARAERPAIGQRALREHATTIHGRSFLSERIVRRLRASLLWETAVEDNGGAFRVHKASLPGEHPSFTWPADLSAAPPASLNAGGNHMQHSALPNNSLRT